MVRGYLYKPTANKRLESKLGLVSVRCPLVVVLVVGV